MLAYDLFDDGHIVVRRRSWNCFFGTYLKLSVSGRGKSSNFILLSKLRIQHQQFVITNSNSGPDVSLFVNALLTAKTQLYNVLLKAIICLFTADDFFLS